MTEVQLQQQKSSSMRLPCSGRLWHTHNSKVFAGKLLSCLTFDLSRLSLLLFFSPTIYTNYNALWGKRGLGDEHVARQDGMSEGPTRYGRRMTRASNSSEQVSTRRARCILDRMDCR